MDTLCKPNFMFLGHTVFEKNAMITCKNSKLHIPCATCSVYTRIFALFTLDIRLRSNVFLRQATRFYALIRPPYARIKRRVSVYIRVNGQRSNTLISPCETINENTMCNSA